eukprot:11554031-Alexandrium_andersonii.AAC.1
MLHPLATLSQAQHWAPGTVMLRPKPILLAKPCPWQKGDNPVPNPNVGLGLHPYRFICRACGTMLQTEGKPSQANGGWAKVWCQGCARTKRVGADTCVLCRQTVRACRCEPDAQRAPRQATVH